MKILMLLSLLILVTGCEITGMAVKEIGDSSDKEERDLVSLNIALVEKDVSICYPIETQPIREQCFMQLAQELKDSSVCRNLIGSLSEICTIISTG